MRRKGQITTEILTYVIGLIIISLIIFFGYRSLSNLQKNKENSELLLFKEKLKNDIESGKKYSDFNAVTYKITGFDELCFADLKQVNPNIVDNPTIKDSITSKEQKNIFLLGKNRFEAFFADGLELLYPYYSCSKIIDGIIEVKIEGKGDSAIIATQTSELIVDRACPAGIYSLGEPNADIGQNILSNQDIDGIAIRYQWDDMEPVEGQFNWGYIDKIIRDAKANNKKVSIRLISARMPNWAKQNIEFFSYVEDGKTRQIGIPWDRLYMERWFKVVEELAKRYNDNDVVTLVAITGSVTPKSAEMHLPNKPNSIVDNWINAGYTREKHENAWKKTIDKFAEEFPDKKLALTIAVQLPIPSENDVINLPKSLVQYATENYPDKILVQNNGLTAKSREGDWQGIFDIIKDASIYVDTGFQMTWWVTGDKARMAGEYIGGSEEFILKKAIDKGLEAGSSYMEIYEQDILNPKMHDILKDASVRLKENSKCFK